MLNRVIIFLLVVVFSFDSVLAAEARRDTITVNSKTLRPCKDPSLTVRKTFDKPMEARIVKHRLEGWLYIQCPTVQKGMNLNACYLPVEACQEGLRILITGNLLTSPGIERANLRALPFQLTSLKVIRE